MRCAPLALISPSLQNTFTYGFPRMLSHSLTVPTFFARRFAWPQLREQYLPRHEGEDASIPWRSVGLDA